MLLTLASAALLAVHGEGPIDFTTIPRTLGRLPELAAQEPRYGMFLFVHEDERGERAWSRMWAVLDESARGVGRYDVLYLDLDADGDLTGPGERFQLPAGQGELRLGPEGGQPVCRFEVGTFVQPGTTTRHTGFEIVWTPGRVSYRMMWRGEKVTMGGYAPVREEYADFAASPAEAPIFVPGHDLPFQFERWIRNELRIGAKTDFKVFVGNRGCGQGTFSCVDDKFLPKSEHLLATLIYRDATGAERRYQSKLEERC